MDIWGSSSEEAEEGREDGRKKFFKKLVKWGQLKKKNKI